MTPGLGIEPGTYWWKASALTTAPTLFDLYGHYAALRTCLQELNLHEARSVQLKETLRMP